MKQQTKQTTNTTADVTLEAADKHTPIDKRFTRELPVIMRFVNVAGNIDDPRRHAVRVRLTKDFSGVPAEDKVSIPLDGAFGALSAIQDIPKYTREDKGNAVILSAPVAGLVRGFYIGNFGWIMPWAKPGLVSFGEGAFSFFLHREWIPTDNQHVGRLTSTLGEVTSSLIGMTEVYIDKKGDPKEGPSSMFWQALTAGHLFCTNCDVTFSVTEGNYSRLMEFYRIIDAENPVEELDTVRFERREDRREKRYTNNMVGADMANTDRAAVAEMVSSAVLMDGAGNTYQATQLPSGLYRLVTESGLPDRSRQLKHNPATHEGLQERLSLARFVAEHKLRWNRQS